MQKILIISHNSINDTDNMGRTIGNIFSKFPDEELCQLFFRKQNVKSNNCKSFFCIDDVSVLKSVIKRWTKTGTEIEEKEYKFEEINELEENTFQRGRKRTGTIYILRNLMWSLGKWKTKELDNWIRKNKPTCIFYFAGDYTFSFNITMKLSKKYNIPIYTYFSDEFYRFDTKNGLLKRLYKTRYRNRFRKLIKECKQYYCITDEMQEFYEKTFNKKGLVIMNTTEIQRFPEQKYDDKIVLSYIGNLGYDRWKSILDIGQTLTTINNETNKKIEFNLYSGEKNKDVIEKLKENQTINYKGFINNEEVINVIKASNVLLHVEDFDKFNIDKVKYSISTKIPDSLASGRLLLAYGPSDIASIKYIKNNNVGIVANNKEELKGKLLQIGNETINKEEIIENAIKIVEERHRNENIYNILKNIGDYVSE